VATGREGTESGRGTPAPASRLSTSALLVLIWLVAGSAALLLFWGSKLTFLLDDWEFLVYRPGFTAHAVFDPHGENIVVAPVLIYKALLATFGMSSAFPYRVVATLLFLASAVLLFVLLRRRVGQWPALAATAVVLFLGAAWEDLLWPFQVNYFGAMAAGLGMLLALERRSRRGDGVACLLLSLSVVFSSLGLTFIVGAAVEVLTRSDRWRRLWIVAIPVAIYLAWYLGWGHTAESALSLSNVGKTPAFVFNSLTASLASLLGLASPWLGLEDGSDLGWLRLLGGLALLAFAWRVYVLRGGSRWLWILVALALSFWVLAGLNQMEGREPNASRYQYVGAVFVLLVAAELLRGVELRRGATILVGAVAACAVASNIQALHSAYDHFYHPISQLEKADLGAVEIARDTVEPGFVLETDIADTGFVHIEAGPYLLARDEYGSPAYTPAEIAASSVYARFAADKVLFAALRIEAAAGGAKGFPGSTPVATDGGPVTVPATGCVSVAAAGGASPWLRLPPGGVVFRADGPASAVQMRRFSTGRVPITLTEEVPAGLVVRVPIPVDRSRTPWKLALRTAGTTVACGLEAGA